MGKKFRESLLLEDGCVRVAWPVAQGASRANRRRRPIKLERARSFHLQIQACVCSGSAEDVSSLCRAKRLQVFIFQLDMRRMRGFLCFYSLRGLLYSSREYHVPSPVTQIWVGSKCLLRLELFTLPATPPRSWGPVLTSSENVGFKVSPMRPPQAAPRPCRCS